MRLIMDFKDGFAIYETNTDWGRYIGWTECYDLDLVRHAEMIKIIKEKGKILINTDYKDYTEMPVSEYKERIKYVRN